MTKANILIVEDERIIAEDLRLRLEDAGYGVPAVVASGEAAIVEASRTRPDLVLMDIVLAGRVDGIQAARQINAQFDLPVVYLTAYSDAAILERAKASCPAGYILKPFSESQLLAAIELALSTHQATRRAAGFKALASRPAEEKPMAAGVIRVLLIEDDPDDVLLLREALAEADGRYFRVEHADRLATGLARLARGGIDLLVLDLSLPDSLGLATLCVVQAHAAETPIVVLSGGIDEATAVEAVRLGAQDYLVKGRVDSWLLARTLHHALERHRLYQAVRASEAHARQVIESATDAILVVDQQGVVRMANPAAGALLGRPAAGLVGEPFGFPITADEARELTLMREGGETAVAEMRVAEVAWEGEPARLALLRDITERKYTEQARQVSSDILDALNAAPDVTEAFPKVADNLRRLTGCEHASLTLFDKRREGYVLVALDRPHLELDKGSRRILSERPVVKDVLAGRVHLTPDLAAEADAPIEQILHAAGYGSRLNLPLRSHERVIGSLNLAWRQRAGYDTAQLPLLQQIADAVALAVEKSWLLDETRRQAARAAALADVSQTITLARLDARAVADKAAECAAGLIGETAVVALISADGEWLDPVAVHDPNPEIQAFTRGLLAASRYRIGEGMAGWVAQTGAPILAPVITPHQAHEMINPAHQPFVERVGMASLLIVPLRAEGVVIGTLGLTRSRPDHPYTTDDQAFLQALADRAALAIVNARLCTAQQEINAELKIALQAKDEMIQNVSHELRTPLTIIQGYAQLLNKIGQESLDTMQQQAFGAIHQQTERLLFMVNRLLTLQTFHVGQLRLAALDLGPWLAAIATTWQIRAADAGIRLIVEGWQEPLTISADADFLGQVMENLLDNALKFSPNGGAVTIRVWRASGQTSDASEVWIAINDQGVGMPPDKLNQIFGRFHRLETGTVRRFRGCGIGLALCQTIIEAHGGRIWAESAGEGLGSTFYVALPQRYAKEYILPDHSV